jgi:TP901 family phage tail tape measure protein
MANALIVGRLVATLGLNTSAFQAGATAATKTMMLMGRTMTRFVTLPMLLAGGAAVKRQKDFGASMTKIKGLVGVAGDVVDDWSKKVLEMAKVTGRGPEELADALYFVASAGIRGAEALEVLEMSAKASAAGLGETKVIADLVTSAMNAYGKENLSAAEATDILVASVREGKAEADALAGAMGMVLPIASAFGVSFDQVGAAFAGMTRTGTSARVASTQLKAILSAMASPSGEAEKAMSKFNYSAEQFRRTVREKGLIEALLELKNVTKGNESAMADVFPNIRALMGSLDLLGSNMDYNVRIFESLKNASGSLERAFAEVGGTTNRN